MTGSSPIRRRRSPRSRHGSPSGRNAGNARAAPVFTRRALWAREDLAAIWRAYEVADPEGPEARLIGAVLLHAIDEPDDPLRTRLPQTVTLAAGEPLITQGQQVQRMLIVLESSEPLVVMRAVGDVELARCRRAHALALPSRFVVSSG